MPASLSNFISQMKNFLFSRSLFLIALLFNAEAFSQMNNPKTGTVKLVAKFKPPKVNTFLGRNQNGATVTETEGQQLISLPLRVSDSAKNSYTVLSYQFLYR